MSRRFSAFLTIDAEGNEALVEFDRENQECWLQVSETALMEVSR